MRGNITTFRDRFASHPDRRRSEELIALFAGIAAAGTAAAAVAATRPQRDAAWNGETAPEGKSFAGTPAAAETARAESGAESATDSNTGSVEGNQPVSDSASAEAGTAPQSALAAFLAGAPAAGTPAGTGAGSHGIAAADIIADAVAAAATGAEPVSPGTWRNLFHDTAGALQHAALPAPSVSSGGGAMTTTPSVSTGTTSGTTAGTTAQADNIFTDSGVSTAAASPTLETALETSVETVVETGVDSGIAMGSGASLSGESAESSESDAVATTPLTLGETVSVSGGMVTTLEIETDRNIASISVLGDPDVGNVTVNPDNTLAVVLSGSDYSGSLSFDIEVTYGNGAIKTQTVTLDVAEPEEAAGWGFGEHYMLETDDNGDLIVETGETHRKVYVTASEDGLTAADIARIEGIDASAVTAEWLADHPEYGATEDTALAADIGLELWYEITREDGESSHWLLFEKGYTYDDIGGTDNSRLVSRGVSGEDALHPIYISSWGEGDRPVLGEKVYIFQEDSQYIVFDDVAFADGVTSLSGDNIIFNDVYSEGMMNLKDGSGLTVRDSEIANVVLDTPSGDTWSGFTQGLYSSGTSGLLLDGNIFWHNGWEDGYDLDGSTDYGMPANGHSHNIYLQNDTTDVTFTNNISAQGSSFGAQFRGGAYIEGNLLLDNNIALAVFGGIYGTDGAIGNFSFVADNVITSGAGKENNYYLVGAYTAGVWDKSYGATYLDNLIAHLADPNNAEEQAEKDKLNYALNIEQDTTYNDTVIYNWGNETDTAGVDSSSADQTTIQLYAAALLGDPDATISDLMAYLVALADTDLDDTITAETIVAWFQEGFGIEIDGDASATSHTFIPNALASGMRWGNSINWDSETVPEDGDSVDLNGNWVHYGATTTLANLDLGDGGELYVNYGRLTVDDTLSVGSEGGLIRTLSAGQFWMDGYSDRDQLTIEVEGGRFANTGDVTGSTLLVASDGQTILATDGGSYHVTAGSELRVTGSSAVIGFDGDDDNGLAFLSLEDSSILSFIADAAGVSTIEEFHSGKWEDSGVKSGVSLNGTLSIDLSDYTGGAGEFTLIEVDELIGRLDDYEITGLGAAYDARLVVNYNTDTVTLAITAGHGGTSLDTLGSSSLSAGIVSEDVAYGSSDLPIG